MSSKVTFLDKQAAVEYDCVICLEKLCKPVYIGCGSHIFCHECITDLLSHTPGNKFPCPSCRKLCHTKHINRMEWIDRRMDQLQVRCPNWEITPKKAQMIRDRNSKINHHNHNHNNSDNHRHRSSARNYNGSASNSTSSRSRSRDRKRSETHSKREDNDSRDRDRDRDGFELCDWTGAWSELKKHKSQCALHAIKCTYCHNLIVRKDTMHHNKECKFYPIQCEQCTKCNIPRNKMSNHLNGECELGRIQCSKCKQVLVRKEMERHKTECPETKVLCDYRNVGCKVMIKRKDTDKHYANFLPFHLGLIRKQNTELNKNLSQLQQRNLDLERKNVTLQNKLAQYQLRMNSMENRMNVLTESLRRNSNNNYPIILSDDESEQDRIDSDDDDESVIDSDESGESEDGHGSEGSSSNEDNDVSTSPYPRLRSYQSSTSNEDEEADEYSYV